MTELGRRGWTHETTVPFRIHAISTDVLDSVRATGIDASGTPVEYLLAEGGEPPPATD